MVMSPHFSLFTAENMEIRSLGGNLKIRRFLLFFLIVSSVLVCNGCTLSPTDPKDFRDTCFRAEIDGLLGEIAFGAIVERTPAESRITYLRPSALEGIVLCKRGDRVFIKNGEQTQEIDREAITGLLSPLTVLSEREEPTRIQKTEEGTALTPKSGGTLRLNKNGHPVAYESDVLRFLTVWWEAEKAES
jgi:hypothetical protein